MTLPSVAVPAHTIGAAPRLRLIKRIDELCEHSVTIVRAPAGFGKTTLLAQWKVALDSRKARTAWLSIDPPGPSSKDLIDRLAALVEADPQELCAVFERKQAPDFVFIDDAHLCARSSLKTLFALIEHVPSHIHFILSTRGKLGVGLGRLRCQHRVAEFGARAIAFDHQEAAELLGHLDKSERTKLIWKMGGWPTGLDMAARCRPGRAPQISGRSPELVEFLAEELFDRQPAHIKEFLFNTSFLSSMSASLCNAVCEIENSAEILAQLECDGIPIFPLDDEQEEWRYLTVFAEFLQHAGGVENGDRSKLRRRAADWYARRGDIPRALEQLYLAGALDLYAALLEEHCEDLTYDGKILAVKKYADRLPHTTIEALPNLMLALAWLRIRQLRFDEARRLLTKVANIIEAPHSNSEQHHKLRLVAAHREVALSVSREHMDDVVENSKRLIAAMGDTQPHLACSLYSQMAYACCDKFQIAEINRLEPQARAALRDDHSFVSIGVLATLGISLFAAGRTDEAHEAFLQSCDRAAPYRGLSHMEGINALSALPLAELLYEWDEREQARNLIAKFRLNADHFCFSDQMISCFVTAARIAQADNDDETALRVIEEGMRKAWESGLERIRLAMVAEKVRLLIRKGHPKEALAVGKAEGISPDTPIKSPGQGASLASEFIAISWVRLAQSAGRIQDAISLSKQWRAFCASRGTVRALVRWNIMLVRLHALDGNPQAAQRALHEAVVAATAGRFIRSFLDEGPLVARILYESYGKSVHELGDGAQGEDRFVRTVLSASGFEPKAAVCDDMETCGEGLYGRLSNKELEILDLVGRGLRNREIGTRLGLTEGTVKWYMQQIYDKLGVRRRPQAVEQARKFGILS